MKSSGSPSATRDRPVDSRRTVLLDANALFLPLTTGIDLEAEAARLTEGLQLAVPHSVLGELERLVAENVPFANAALSLALRFPQVPNAGRGDSAVVDLARRGGFAVLTADRALQRRLRTLGIDLVIPRDRARLAWRRGIVGPSSRNRPQSAMVKPRPKLRRRRPRGRS